mmetsp:Transcript_11314/g.16390  ORF Transcript_11314/g.16390 Transcript_11314/m.16390 type:complete len:113 (-) Transcript_11314:1007-1345(-)
MGLKLIDIFLSRCQKIPNIPSFTFALCTTQRYKRNLAEIKRYSEKSHERTGGEMNLVPLSALSLFPWRKNERREIRTKSRNNGQVPEGTSSPGVTIFSTEVTGIFVSPANKM